jgi:hypothetical protein
MKQREPRGSATRLAASTTLAATLAVPALLMTPSKALADGWLTCTAQDGQRYQTYTVGCTGYAARACYCNTWTNSENGGYYSGCRAAYVCT